MIAVLLVLSPLAAQDANIYDVRHRREKELLQIAGVRSVSVAGVDGNLHLVVLVENDEARAAVAAKVGDRLDGHPVRVLVQSPAPRVVVSGPGQTVSEPARAERVPSEPPSPVTVARPSEPPQLWITSHDVDIQIARGIALVRHDIKFRNPADETREGTLHVQVPDDGVACELILRRHIAASERTAKVCERAVAGLVYDAVRALTGGLSPDAQRAAGGPPPGVTTVAEPDPVREQLTQLLLSRAATRSEVPAIQQPTTTTTNRRTRLARWDGEDPAVLDALDDGTYGLRFWPVPGRGEQAISLFVVAPLSERGGRACLRVPLRWEGNADFANDARRRLRLRIAACEKAANIATERCRLILSTPPEIDTVDAWSDAAVDTLELSYDRGSPPAIRDDIDWEKTSGVASLTFFTWERAEFCWKGVLAMRAGTPACVVAEKTKIPTKRLSLIVVEKWIARVAVHALAAARNTDK